VITVVDALESELISFLLIFLLRISQYPAIHGIPDVNLNQRFRPPATACDIHHCPMPYNIDINRAEDIQRW
jgi:hypothetical protein